MQQFKTKRILSALTAFSFLATTLFAPGTLLYAEPSSFVAEARVRENWSQWRLPAELGQVTEIHLPSSKSGTPLVIHIQDAHAVYDAQKSIQQIVERLQRDFGLPLVALEGAVGGLDPVLFRSFPAEEAKRKLFDRLMRKGEISGADAAAVLNREWSDFVGIEDRELYLKDREAYLAALRLKERAVRAVEERLREIEEEQSRIYSKELLEFGRKTGALDSGEEGLVRLLKETELSHISKERFPHIHSVVEALQSEMRLEEYEKDRQGIGLERLAREIKGRLGPEELSEYQTREREHRSEGKRLAWVEFLEEEAEKKGISLKAYRNLLLRERKEAALRGLTGETFFEELHSWIAARKESLFRSEEERRLEREAEAFRAILRLAALEISRNDLQKLEGLPEFSSRLAGGRPHLYSAAQTVSARHGSGEASAFPGSRREIPDSLVRLLIPALRFYELALMRDQALFENLSKAIHSKKASVAAVVTGGFHTEGIKGLLREKGYPYLIISPRIENIGESSYLDAMLEKKPSYGKFLKQGVTPGRFQIAPVDLLSPELVGQQRWDAIQKGWAGELVGLEIKGEEAALERIFHRWRDGIVSFLLANRLSRDSGAYVETLRAIHKDLVAELPGFERFEPRTLSGVLAGLLQEWGGKQRKSYEDFFSTVSKTFDKSGSVALALRKVFGHRSELRNREETPRSSTTTRFGPTSFSLSQSIYLIERHDPRYLNLSAADLALDQPEKRKELEREFRGFLRFELNIISSLMTRLTEDGTAVQLLYDKMINHLLRVGRELRLSRVAAPVAYMNANFGEHVADIFLDLVLTELREMAAGQAQLFGVYADSTHLVAAGIPDDVLQNQLPEVWTKALAKLLQTVPELKDPQLKEKLDLLKEMHPASHARIEIPRVEDISEEQRKPPLPVEAREADYLGRGLPPETAKIIAVDDYRKALREWWRVMLAVKRQDYEDLTDEIGIFKAELEEAEAQGNQPEVDRLREQIRRREASANHLYQQAAEYAYLVTMDLIKKVLERVEASQKMSKELKAKIKELAGPELGSDWFLSDEIIQTVKRKLLRRIEQGDKEALQTLTDFYAAFQKGRRKFIPPVAYPTGKMPRLRHMIGRLTDKDSPDGIYGVEKAWKELLSAPVTEERITEFKRVYDRYQRARNELLVEAYRDVRMSGIIREGLPSGEVKTIYVPYYVYKLSYMREVYEAAKDGKLDALKAHLATVGLRELADTISSSFLVFKRWAGDEIRGAYRTADGKWYISKKEYNNYNAHQEQNPPEEEPPIDRSYHRAIELGLRDPSAETLRQGKGTFSDIAAYEAAYNDHLKEAAPEWIKPVVKASAEMARKGIFDRAQLFAAKGGNLEEGPLYAPWRDGWYKIDPLDWEIEGEAPGIKREDLKEIFDQVSSTTTVRERPLEPGEDIVHAHKIVDQWNLLQKKLRGKFHGEAGLSGKSATFTQIEAQAVKRGIALPAEGEEPQRSEFRSLSDRLDEGEWFVFPDASPARSEVRNPREERESYLREFTNGHSIDLLETIRAGLRERPGRRYRILDLGSGARMTLLRILKQEFGGAVEAVGVDKDPAIRAEDLKREGLLYLRGEGSRLIGEMTTRGEAFDLIVSQGAFAYFENKKEALENIKRLLRPGGIASIHILNPNKNLPQGLGTLEALKEEGYRITHVTGSFGREFEFEEPLFESDQFGPSVTEFPTDVIRIERTEKEKTRRTELRTPEGEETIARDDISLIVVHAADGSTSPYSGEGLYDHDRLTQAPIESILREGHFGRAYEYQAAGHPTNIDERFSRRVIQQTDGDYRIEDLQGRAFILTGGGYNACHLCAFENLAEHFKKHRQTVFEVHFPADAIYWNEEKYEDGENWLDVSAGNLDYLKARLDGREEEKANQSYLKKLRERGISYEVLMFENEKLLTVGREGEAPQVKIYLWQDVKTMTSALRKREPRITRVSDGEVRSEIAAWVAKTKEPTLITIEGEMGAGKSTLGRILAHDFQEKKIPFTRGALIEDDEPYDIFFAKSGEKYKEVADLNRAYAAEVTLPLLLRRLNEHPVVIYEGLGTESYVRGIGQELAGKLGQPVRWIRVLVTRPEAAQPPLYDAALEIITAPKVTARSELREGSFWSSVWRLLISSGLLLFMAIGMTSSCCAVKSTAQAPQEERADPLRTRLRRDAEESARLFNRELPPQIPGSPVLRKREPMSLLEKLLFTGVVIGGSAYFAHHNKGQDDLNRVLAFDLLGNGLIASLGHYFNGETDLEILADDFLWGSGGGLVMFSGKELMSHKIDEDGWGFPAKFLHSAGASIRDNAMYGRDPLERFEFDIGPLLLGLNLKEESPILDFSLLPDSLYFLTETLIEGNKFDWETTQRVGVFSFLGEDLPKDYHSGIRAAGFAPSNYIIIDQEIEHLYGETFLGSLRMHEAVHAAFQYREMSFAGAPFDRFLHQELSVPDWIRFDFGLGDYFLASFSAAEEEHDKRLNEREPEIWQSKTYLRLDRPEVRASDTDPLNLEALLRRLSPENPDREARKRAESELRRALRGAQERSLQERLSPSAYFTWYSLVLDSASRLENEEGVKGLLDAVRPILWETKRVFGTKPENVKRLAEPFLAKVSGRRLPLDLLKVEEAVWLADLLDRAELDEGQTELMRLLEEETDLVRNKELFELLQDESLTIRHLALKILELRKSVNALALNEEELLEQHKALIESRVKASGVYKLRKVTRWAVHEHSFKAEEEGIALYMSPDFSGARRLSLFGAGRGEPLPEETPGARKFLDHLLDLLEVVGRLFVSTSKSETSEEAIVREANERQVGAPPALRYEWDSGEKALKVHWTEPEGGVTWTVPRYEKKEKRYIEISRGSLRKVLEYYYGPLGPLDDTAGALESRSETRSNVPLPSGEVTWEELREVVGKFTFSEKAPLEAFLVRTKTPGRGVSMRHEFGEETVLPEYFDTDPRRRDEKGRPLIVRVSETSVIPDHVIVEANADATPENVLRGVVASSFRLYPDEIRKPLETVQRAFRRLAREKARLSARSEVRAEIAFKVGSTAKIKFEDDDQLEWSEFPLDWEGDEKTRAEFVKLIDRTLPQISPFFRGGSVSPDFEVPAVLLATKAGRSMPSPAAFVIYNKTEYLLYFIGLKPDSQKSADHYFSLLRKRKLRPVVQPVFVSLPTEAPAWDMGEGGLYLKIRPSDGRSEVRTVDETSAVLGNIDRELQRLRRDEETYWTPRAFPEYPGQYGSEPAPHPLSGPEDAQMRLLDIRAQIQELEKGKKAEPRRSEVRTIREEKGRDFERGAEKRELSGRASYARGGRDKASLRRILQVPMSQLAFPWLRFSSRLFGYHELERYVRSRGQEGIHPNVQLWTLIPPSTFRSSAELLWKGGSNWKGVKELISPLPEGGKVVEAWTRHSRPEVREIGEKEKTAESIARLSGSLRDTTIGPWTEPIPAKTISHSKAGVNSTEGVGVEPISPARRSPGYRPGPLTEVVTPSVVVDRLNRAQGTRGYNISQEKLSLKSSNFPVRSEVRAFDWVKVVVLLVALGGIGGYTIKLYDDKLYGDSNQSLEKRPLSLRDSWRNLGEELFVSEKTLEEMAALGYDAPPSKLSHNEILSAISGLTLEIAHKFQGKETNPSLFAKRLVDDVGRALLPYLISLIEEGEDGRLAAILALKVLMDEDPGVFKAVLDLLPEEVKTTQRGSKQITIKGGLEQLIRDAGIGKVLHTMRKQMPEEVFKGLSMTSRRFALFVFGIMSPYFEQSQQFQVDRAQFLLEVLSYADTTPRSEDEAKEEMRFRQEALKRLQNLARKDPFAKDQIDRYLSPALAASIEMPEAVVNKGSGWSAKGLLSEWLYGDDPDILFVSVSGLDFLGFKLKSPFAKERKKAIDVLSRGNFFYRVEAGLIFEQDRPLLIELFPNFESFLERAMASHDGRMLMEHLKIEKDPEVRRHLEQKLQALKVLYEETVQAERSYKEKWESFSKIWPQVKDLPLDQDMVSWDHLPLLGVPRSHKFMQFKRWHQDPVERKKAIFVLQRNAALHIDEGGNRMYSEGYNALLSQQQWEKEPDRGDQDVLKYVEWRIREIDDFFYGNVRRNLRKRSEVRDETTRREWLLTVGFFGAGAIGICGAGGCAAPKRIHEDQLYVFYGPHLGKPSAERAFRFFDEAIARAFRRPDGKPNVIWLHENHSIGAARSFLTQALEIVTQGPGAFIKGAPAVDRWARKMVAQPLPDRLSIYQDALREYRTDPQFQSEVDQSMERVRLRIGKERVYKPSELLKSDETGKMKLTPWGKLNFQHLRDRGDIPVVFEDDQNFEEGLLTLMATETIEKSRTSLIRGNYEESRTFYLQAQRILEEVSRRRDQALSELIQRLLSADPTRTVIHYRGFGHVWNHSLLSERLERSGHLKEDERPIFMFEKKAANPQFLKSTDQADNALFLAMVVRLLASGSQEQADEKLFTVLEPVIQKIETALNQQNSPEAVKQWIEDFVKALSQKGEKAPDHPNKAFFDLFLERGYLDRNGYKEVEEAGYFSKGSERKGGGESALSLARSEVHSARARRGTPQSRRLGGWTGTRAEVHPDPTDPGTPQSSKRLASRAEVRGGADFPESWEKGYAELKKLKTLLRLRKKEIPNDLPDEIKPAYYERVANIYRFALAIWNRWKETQNDSYYGIFERYHQEIAKPLLELNAQTIFFILHSEAGEKLRLFVIEHQSVWLADERMLSSVVNNALRHKPEWVDVHGYLLPVVNIAVEFSGAEALTKEQRKKLDDVTALIVASGWHKTRRWAIATIPSISFSVEFIEKKSPFAIAFNIIRRNTMKHVMDSEWWAALGMDKAYSEQSGKKPLAIKNARLNKTEAPRYLLVDLEGDLNIAEFYLSAAKRTQTLDTYRASIFLMMKRALSESNATLEVLKANLKSLHRIETKWLRKLAKRINKVERVIGQGVIRRSEVRLEASSTGDGTRGAFDEAKRFLLSLRGLEERSEEGEREGFRALVKIVEAGRESFEEFKGEFFEELEKRLQLPGEERLNQVILDLIPDFAPERLREKLAEVGITLDTAVQAEELAKKLLAAFREINLEANQMTLLTAKAEERFRTLGTSENAPFVASAAERISQKILGTGISNKQPSPIRVLLRIDALDPRELPLLVETLGLDRLGVVNGEIVVYLDATQRKHLELRKEMERTLAERRIQNRVKFNTYSDWKAGMADIAISYRGAVAKGYGAIVVTPEMIREKVNQALNDPGRVPQVAVRRIMNETTAVLAVTLGRIQDPDSEEARAVVDTLRRNLEEYGINIQKGPLGNLIVSWNLERLIARIQAELEGLKATARAA